MTIRALVYSALLAGWALGLTGCAPATDRGAAPTGQLRLGALLGETDLAGYRRALEPRTFRFPQDHGPHPGFRSEWWYLTFMLEDEAGSPVGVQFTLFRQALSPRNSGTANRWKTNQVYLAHFALTHGDAGTHRAAERFARGHPRLAGAVAEPFEIWLEDWRLRADGDHWHLTAATASVAADLVLAMDRPVVLQGDGGLSRKGDGQASYYYSVPGMEVTGHIRVNGRRLAVAGNGWLDREWSTSVLPEGTLGWDWFALVLDDGRRAMLYQLRRRDGTRNPFDQGMLVVPGAPARTLTAPEFRLVPERLWRDPDGVGWPVAWTVHLGEEVWRVEAVLDDQRMATTIRYWEGLVTVRDEAGRHLGYGYLELTGYDVQNGRRPGQGPGEANGEEGRS